LNQLSFTIQLYFGDKKPLRLTKRILYIKYSASIHCEERAYMRTVHVSKEEVEKKWYLIDAEGKILGRLASEISNILRGKHKAIFSPHIDTGDFVIVVNAEKIKLTGNKLKGKIYYHHSGYPGGIKAIMAEKLMAKKPEEIIRKAVKGMLPKNRLGRKIFKKLKVYAGPIHPHEAQQPESFEL